MAAAANAQPVITFNAKTDFTTGYATPWTVPIGDLNSDGKPDLVVANPESNDLRKLKPKERR